MSPPPNTVLPAGGTVRIAADADAAAVAVARGLAREGWRTVAVGDADIELSSGYVGLADGVTTPLATVTEVTRWARALARGRRTARRADPASVAAALRAAGHSGRYGEISLDGSGCTPVSQLYRDPTAINAMIDAFTARLQPCERRVAASMAHIEYTLRLWSVVLGAFTADRIVPDLRRLRHGYSRDGRIRLALTGAPGGWRLTDERAAIDLVTRTVLDDHVRPFQAALRQTGRLATGLMWGNTASMLVSAVRKIGGEKPPALLRQLTAQLLATPPLRGATRHGVADDGGVVPDSVVRRSCCLCYRLAGYAPCGDCPLRGSTVATAWAEAVPSSTPV